MDVHIHSPKNGIFIGIDPYPHSYDPHPSYAGHVACLQFLVKAQRFSHGLELGLVDQWLEWSRGSGTR